VQWLPDGSGFLFTKTGDFRSNANVYRYDFAQGAVTQLTQFTNAFAIDISASPDGQWIAFERSTTIELTTGDVWIMHHDGSDMRQLVQNGLRPSWSQRAPQPPKQAYVPLIWR
jgi:Tol biopolymer transport system component